ncbi:hypothetical protein Malapachy_1608 [Malassezia pachydermatis]|uniref:Uncharacterized protein n=1 Tax=Malassezia pachydermatis TaxID=77020 RepID=A0A0M8MK66_9BASI|nr:hypothetical protein Malapachy_1608 [Malassezia pachydermatis]KOS13198.1 hypothetical protein Malapachy_1608 [Malassezia pachydermatis]
MSWNEWPSSIVEPWLRSAYRAWASAWYDVGTATAGLAMAGTVALMAITCAQVLQACDIVTFVDEAYDSRMDHTLE